MDVFIHWTRPDGVPGDTAERKVDEAVTALIEADNGIGWFGTDKGTDFTTGERDVTYMLTVEDFTTAEVIRAHLAIIALVGQHPAAGTMTVAKGA